MKRNIMRPDMDFERKFTDIQLLDYIFDFFCENHQIPPLLNIADNFSVAQNAVFERMQKLERDGFLKRNSVNKLMFCDISLESIKNIKPSQFFQQVTEGEI